MKTLRTLTLAAMAGIAAAAGPGAALAHHSGAMFDHTKVVTLTGTIKEWQWKNPHAWIVILAPGKSGAATEYSIECSTINILARKGWTSQSFKPGDKISLTMNPMKDGTASGLVLKATTVDGHELPDHDY